MEKYCDNVLTTDAIVDPGGRDEGRSEASVGAVKAAVGAGSSTCEKECKDIHYSQDLSDNCAQRCVVS